MSDNIVQASIDFDNSILQLKARKALRLTVDVYDDEIMDLIQAAREDLGIAGVIVRSNSPIMTQAIITYCRLHFSSLADGEFDRLKKSYDEQKAQLSTATGYTKWGRDE